MARGIKNLTTVETAELKGKKTKAVKTPGGCKLFMPEDDIEEVLNSSWAEVLDTGKVSNDSFLGKLIQQSANRISIEASKNAETAMFAINSINKIAKNTSDYFNKKKSVDSDFAEYTIRKALFPWQKEVFDDANLRKLLICSRRTGKTYFEAAYMLAHCMKPFDQIEVNGRIIEKKRSAIYVGMTIEKAAANIWQTLQDLAKACHLSNIKFDNGKYRATFSNGNFIQLAGNSNKQEREKIRGSEWSLAIVDEVQSAQAMYYLMSSILEPIISARHGEIILSGTGPLIKGYWSDMIENCESKGWSLYHKSIFDNPTIENPEQVLEQVKEANGWTDSNITFRREYKAEICWDDNLLIYPKVVYYDEIPKDFTPTLCYISCDLGFADRSAVEAVLFDDFGEGYLFSEWCKAKQDSTTIFNQILATKDAVKSKYPNVEFHVVTDTNEQNMTRDWYNRGLTELELAIKYELSYSYALLNEYLSSGRLKIKKNGPADEDHEKTSYKWDAETQQIIYEEDKKNWHEDATAALRYAIGNYQSLVSLGS